MAATEPAVSVVIPSRNAAGTLAECLDSVAAQTLANHEVLVVDDGSTDHTVAMLRRRLRTDSRLRLLTPGRVGLAGALNHGIAHARAGLLARIDADDRMHPQRLALQHRFLACRPRTALVASRVRLFPARHVANGMREYLRWQDSCTSARRIADDIYVEAPFAHPSVMMRTQVVRTIGGYRDGEFPEDYDLWLRMSASGHRLAKLARVLTDWRQHPGSLSRTDPRYSREAFDRLRAGHLARDPRLHQGRPLAWWGAGRRTRLRSRHLLGLGVRPHSWIDIDPRKLGNRLEGAPVLPPDWLLEARPVRPFVLGWVNRHGARDEIAGWLERGGFRRGRDYLMVG